MVFLECKVSVFMSNQFEHILYKKNDRGVVEITLNRPDLHNAFNAKMIQEIKMAFLQVANDHDARLVKLSAKGKSFCAGADLAWMKSMANYTFDENVSDAKELASMFMAIDACPLPVIGAVHGHALGGGMGLIAVCDYVISFDGPLFGFTETRLGLIPAVISPFCLKKIGPAWAHGSFLSGQKFGVHEMAKMNLVHLTSTKEKFEEDVQNVIEEYLKAAPLAQKEAKKLIKFFYPSVDETQIQFVCEQIARRRVSAEGQEGMKALLEKRQPQFDIQGHPHGK